MFTELPIILFYNQGPKKRRVWLIMGLVAALACAGYYAWKGPANMSFWHPAPLFVSMILGSAYALSIGIFGYPAVTWKIDHNTITRRIAYRWGASIRTWALHISQVQVNKCHEAYYVPDNDQVADKDNYRVEIKLRNGTWLKLLPMPSQAMAEALADELRGLAENGG